MNNKSINKGEEIQSHHKEKGSRKRMPLPSFLRSIHKPQMWKKSSRKTGRARDFFSRSTNEKQDVVQEEVLTLRAPILTSRNLPNVPNNSASCAQQKGYCFTMEKTSFWTIVASLFFLGFLFFVSGVFVAIYFFKEGIQPTSSENSWVGDVEKKIGVGIVETVEEELWKHAGNSAFTRAVMPNDSSQELSLSGRNSQSPSSHPAVPASAPVSSGDSGQVASSVPASLSSPHAQGSSTPGLAPHSASSLDVSREGGASAPTPALDTLPLVHARPDSHQVGALNGSVPQERGAFSNNSMQIQELIQHPKSHSPSYHTSPLAAGPTRDTQGMVLGEKKPAKEKSYTLNFGIFPTKQKALDRLKKLQRSHPKAIIEEVNKGKEVFFFVVDGVYGSQEGAAEALSKLSKEDKLLFSPKVQPETSEYN